MPGRAFDVDGSLTDERLRGSVEAVGAAVATLAARLRMAPGSPAA
jgi:hypothetical protein